MSISKASAKWEGALTTGKGAMKPAHGPVSKALAGTTVTLKAALG
jgi:hypothetical protein